MEQLSYIVVGQPKAAQNESVDPHRGGTTMTKRQGVYYKLENNSCISYIFDFVKINYYKIDFYFVKIYLILIVHLFHLNESIGYVETRKNIDN